MIWTFSSIMLGTIALTFLSHKTFQSEAKLFVRVGRESVALDPTATIGQVFMVNESRENEINSIFELIRSREILANVVATVGPKIILESDPGVEQVHTASLLGPFNPFGSYSDEDQAIRHLGNQLKIAAIKKSSVINVSYEAKSPELARDIVEAVIDQARDAHLRVNRIQGSHDFFAAETKTRREKLAQLEARRLALKNKAGIASLEDQRLLKLKVISELDTTLLTTQAALLGAKAELKEHHRALDTVPATVRSGETIGMPHSTLATMREQLFALRVHEEEIMSKYHAPHPLALQIRDQVMALQAIVDQEPAQPQIDQKVNAVHQEVNLAALKAAAAVVSLEAQANALKSQLATMSGEVSRLNSYEAELAQLEREVDLEAANYKKYSENLEQARVDGAAETKNISNINILQRPTYSITPIKPRRLMNLAVGLFTALVSSIGVGLLLDQRSTSWNATARTRRRTRGESNEVDAKAFNAWQKDQEGHSWENGDSDDDGSGGVP